MNNKSVTHQSLLTNLRLIAVAPAWAHKEVVKNLAVLSS